MGLKVTVLTDNDIANENGEPRKVPHDKDPSVLYVQYPSLLPVLPAHQPRFSKLLVTL